MTTIFPQIKMHFQKNVFLSKNSITKDFFHKKTQSVSGEGKPRG